MEFNNCFIVKAFDILYKYKTKTFELVNLKEIKSINRVLEIYKLNEYTFSILSESNIDIYDVNNFECIHQIKLPVAAQEMLPIIDDSTKMKTNASID
jgi:hypothetical protein